MSALKECWHEPHPEYPLSSHWPELCCRAIHTSSKRGWVLDEYITTSKKIKEERGNGYHIDSHKLLAQATCLFVIGGPSVVEQRSPGRVPVRGGRVQVQKGKVVRSRQAACWCRRARPRPVGLGASPGSGTYCETSGQLFSLSLSVIFSEPLKSAY